jgi:hypothetical protein
MHILFYLKKDNLINYQIILEYNILLNIKKITFKKILCQLLMDYKKYLILDKIKNKKIENI